MYRRVLQRYKETQERGGEILLLTFHRFPKHHATKSKFDLSQHPLCVSYSSPIFLDKLDKKWSLVQIARRHCWQHFPLITDIRQAVDTSLSLLSYYHHHHHHQSHRQPSGLPLLLAVFWRFLVPRGAEMKAEGNLLHFDNDDCIGVPYTHVSSYILITMIALAVHTHTHTHTHTHV